MTVKGLDDQLTCFYHNAHNTWREATIEQRPLKDYEINDIASTIRAYVETALETLQEARELASCLEIKLDEHDHELTDAAHDAAHWIDSAADGFTFLEILGTIDQEIVERLNTYEYPA
jgi:hypothetical protein